MNNSIANLVLDVSDYPVEVKNLIERLQRIVNKVEYNNIDDEYSEGLAQGKLEIREILGDALYLLKAEKAIFKKKENV